VFSSQKSYTNDENLGWADVVMALFSYCLQTTEKTKSHKEQMCDALGLKTAKKEYLSLNCPKFELKHLMIIDKEEKKV